MSSTPSTRAWWGSYDLEVGRQARWRIGPLQLHVSRRRAEWQLSWLSRGDPKDEAVEVELPSAAEPPAGAETIRFTVSRTEGPLRLCARLADRPVVVKPVTPLYVPGRQQVTLYVGSPVWVRLEVGEPAGELVELPTHRATDTWAGPNTREGHVCYGSRTLAQAELSECRIRPHRAITAVEVRNLADDALVIEQVQLPVPMLALYASADGALWTQSVALVRDTPGPGARLQIGDAPTPPGRAPTRLAEPRVRADGNVVMQAFNRLFG